MFITERERGGGGGGEKEREKESVCVWFLMDSPAMSVSMVNPMGLRHFGSYRS